MAGVDAKLAVDRFVLDEEPHIRVVDHGVCASCESKPCVPVCPAGLYEWSESEGRMILSHEGCLECGACLLVCPHRNLDWSYPRGGFGVRYSYG